MPGVKRHSSVSGGGGLTRELTDLAASVRDRLKALARPGTDDFAVVLVRYGLERLLYRLSRSEWRDRFVLKGAMVFAVWSLKPPLVILSPSLPSVILRSYRRIFGRSRVNSAKNLRDDDSTRVRRPFTSLRVT